MISTNLFLILEIENASPTLYLQFDPLFFRIDPKIFKICKLAPKFS